MGVHILSALLVYPFVRQALALQKENALSFVQDYPLTRTIEDEELHMTLTKATLVDSLFNHFQMPRKQAVQVIETLFEIIKRKLESGEDILISGFGKFCIKEKEQRKGRNPATGETLMLRSRKVVTFQCSSVLRNKINRK